MNLTKDEVFESEGSTWNDAVYSYPPAAVGRKLIMVDKTGGKGLERVWKIMFTDWTVGAQGGGFSWYREEIK